MPFSKQQSRKKFKKSQIWTVPCIVILIVITHLFFFYVTVLFVMGSFTRLAPELALRGFACHPGPDSARLFLMLISRSWFSTKIFRHVRHFFSKICLSLPPHIHMYMYTPVALLCVQAISIIRKSKLLYRICPYGSVLHQLYARFGKDVQGQPLCPGLVHFGHSGGLVYKWSQL